VIVADTNLLVYLFVRGPHTDAATEALSRDPVWVAPPAYRYEFLNVMATHVRKGEFDMQKALDIMRQAEQTVQVLPDPDRELVLRTSVGVSIGSYDCEFVEPARSWRTRVVTADVKLLKTFGDVAVSIDDFAAGK
jgi:predicted nucleic acid-binding protein